MIYTNLNRWPKLEKKTHTKKKGRLDQDSYRVCSRFSQFCKLNHVCSTKSEQRVTEIDAQLRRKPRPESQNRITMLQIEEGPPHQPQMNLQASKPLLYIAFKSNALGDLGDMMSSTSNGSRDLGAGRWQAIKSSLASTSTNMHE
jgi:hypothetical protein